MDSHLERQVALKPQEPGNALYGWSIVEADSEGRQVGPDFIPWEWTNCFTGISCSLQADLTVTDAGTSAETNNGIEHHVIRVALRPCGHFEDSPGAYSTRYSMFGTNRELEQFELNIHPVTKLQSAEACKTWGSVAGAYEIDFQHEESPDFLEFKLFVSPERFARYASQIVQGAVDKIEFEAKGVTGFYAEWTPAVSTRKVKILTRDDCHAIRSVLPDGATVPRLGSVGEARLRMIRNKSLG